MFLTKIKIASTGVLTLLALFVAGSLVCGRLAAQRLPDKSGQAVAQGERRPDGGRARDVRSPEIHGIVKAVDIANSTITVTIGDKRAPVADKLFTLAKDVE